MSKSGVRLVVVAHACHHSPQETEGEGGKFETSLGYISLSNNNEQNPQNFLHRKVSSARQRQVFVVAAWAPALEAGGGSFPTTWVLLPLLPSIPSGWTASRNLGVSLLKSLTQVCRSLQCVQTQLNPLVQIIVDVT